MRCSSRALRGGVAALALAVLTAGCGGGQDDGLGGQGAVGEDLRAQAADVCGQASRLLEGVEWPADEDLTLQTAAPAIQETTEIHRGMLDTLSELPAQPEEQAAIDELVAAGQPIVSALEDLARASAAGDDAAFNGGLEQIAALTEQAAATSERLGLGACYNPA